MGLQDCCRALACACFLRFPDGWCYVNGLSLSFAGTVVCSLLVGTAKQTASECERHINARFCTVSAKHTVCQPLICLCVSFVSGLCWCGLRSVECHVWGGCVLGSQRFTGLSAFVSALVLSCVLTGCCPCGVVCNRSEPIMLCFAALCRAGLLLCKCASTCMGSLLLHIGSANDQLCRQNNAVDQTKGF